MGIRQRRKANVKKYYPPKIHEVHLSEGDKGLELSSYGFVASLGFIAGILMFAAFNREPTIHKLQHLLYKEYEVGAGVELLGAGRMGQWVDHDGRLVVQTKRRLGWEGLNKVTFVKEDRDCKGNWLYYFKRKGE